MKNKKNVRKKVVHPEQPIGSLTPVADFLPSPQELAGAQPMVKVTLAIDRFSLDYFKTTAKRFGGKYQRMMREILRSYARHHGQSNKRSAERRIIRAHKSVAAAAPHFRSRFR